MTYSISTCRTVHKKNYQVSQQLDHRLSRYMQKSHRYHLCADLGGLKMNTRCPPKCVPSAARFFTLCRRTVQLTGKTASARPDYRGRWCAVSRGHPGRPNPPSPRTTLGQLDAAPWELPSTVGCGIAWTRTGDVQATERIPHSSECFYWMRHSGAPRSAILNVVLVYS
ncbi:UNVERIFIED_CONTAM: hypothetical protein FKN15_043094 [Acipenser sinensis]